MSTKPNVWRPPSSQAADGAFARAAKIAHDGDGTAAGGSKPMSKVRAP
jgi:hypothetical protein